MKSHPIQIAFIGVRELHVVTHKPPQKQDGPLKLEGDMAPKLAVKPCDYDEETNTITSFYHCEIGQIESGKTPIFIRVILGVVFKVIDSSKFDIPTASSFVKKYSTVMVHPFLREHVYSLSIKTGFPPIILPSISVPIFKREDMVEK